MIGKKRDTIAHTTVEYHRGSASQRFLMTMFFLFFFALLLSLFAPGSYILFFLVADLIIRDVILVLGFGSYGSFLSNLRVQELVDRQSQMT